MTDRKQPRGKFLPDEESELWDPFSVGVFLLQSSSLKRNVGFSPVLY